MPAAISNDSDYKDKTAMTATTNQDKNANKVLPSPIGERKKSVKIHDPISDQKMLKPQMVCRRGRQLSSSKSEDHLMTTDLGMVRDHYPFTLLKALFLESLYKRSPTMV
jgi:hypothetical protein